MHIIDIKLKGITWGHGWIIGMCSHSTSYISCVEREPGITQDYL